MTDATAEIGDTARAAPEDTLIGCPICDAVYRLSPETAAEATRCARCGYRLTLGRSTAITRVVAIAATNVALMMIVIFLPFLDLQAGTFESRASVLEVVVGFSSGIMVPLAFAVIAFILVLPILRFLFLIYALGPILAGAGNLPNAKGALRWAFKLKPWAMAEIFMIGVAVALIKLADLASVATGPAFWVFGLVVLLNAYQDSFMCRHTLWTALQDNKR